MYAIIPLQLDLLFLYIQLNITFIEITQDLEECEVESDATCTDIILLKIFNVRNNVQIGYVATEQAALTLNNLFTWTNAFLFKPRGCI